MSSLTPDQARALWEAGGFLVVEGLPAGSEYGIDGVYNTVLSFSGTKFLPPGLHLITWSAPLSGPGPRKLDTGIDAHNTHSDAPSSSTPTSTTGVSHPGALPLRQGLVHFSLPRERIVLRWDPKLETLVHVCGSLPSEAQLKALDNTLAPYPFATMESWKKLTSCVTESTVRRVMGGDGRVDGMRPVVGEVDEVKVKARDTRDLGKDGEGVQVPMHDAEEMPLHFIEFDLRRSFRVGAVGEEITRYSRDKSWLLASLIQRLDNDPNHLLAELQLAFILLLHLSSFGAMQTYKRLLSSFTRSTSIHTTTSLFGLSQPLVRQSYISLIKILGAQLGTLPAGVFDAELPEMDVWYIDEIEALRAGIRGGAGRVVDVEIEMPVWADMEGMREVEDAWSGLKRSARRFGWDILALELETGGGRAASTEDEEDDEEGEYAPVVVE